MKIIFYSHTNIQRCFIPRKNPCSQKKKKNASTKHEQKNLQMDSLSPKTNPAPCHALLVICLVLTMTVKQPGLKKFTPTVQSCFQLLEMQLQLPAPAVCSTTPMHRERMRATLKMKEVPQGRASKQRQKGTPY